MSIAAARTRPQNWVGQVATGAKTLLGVVPALLATGCSSVDIVNALVPRDGYQIVRNIAYGEGDRRRLDLYIPDGVPANAPVVIFFYGGSWSEGSKDLYLFVGQALATKGFITVIPDYRLYPEVKFPAFLEDSATAVRWVHDHIAEHGGNPKDVALAGHSAGAYIAVMLSVNPQYLSSVGLDPLEDIRATVGLAGPYDFLPLTDPKLKIIFGPEAQLAQTQPINFAQKSPPMMLMTGDQDETVSSGNSMRLAARLQSNGVTVEERSYTGLNHVTLLGAVSAPLRFLAPVRADIVAYLDHALGQKP